MTGNDIRKSFLDFFAKQGCRVVPSSSLIPKGDPTLLFTSAGMVPLKPYFLGHKKDMTRAASCQKSFRTTDIDRVGTTARHLTFFEMLGNFSFGDYFKEESITWGWEYLTKVAGIDPTRLYVTVYDGKLAPRDEEAYEIWRKVLPANIRDGHIKFLGDDSNFWTMGPTGPCGPCSEIYYDFGPEVAKHPGCHGVGCDCDRYIEIWNHVFTQFDRKEDGTLAQLPRRNIDTGMGLERITAVVQGKTSPFDTDRFAPIADKAASLLSINIEDNADNRLAARVISDHSRACAFLISEGITPSNEGRGYVLRRLIRRAVRYGRLAGRKDPFMHELLPSVISIFNGVYPEIEKHKAQIAETLRAEEERFIETLESGEKQINALFEKYSDTIPGEEAFRLYETFGFPFELTREIAGRQGRGVDEKGFEEAKTKAQELAKSGWKGSGQKETFSFNQAEEAFPASKFTGYETISGPAAIVGLMDASGKIAKTIPAGEEGYVALDSTPFYAESGGQVGDTGVFHAEGRLAAKVLDTQRPVSKIILHRVKALEALVPGMKITASVDKAQRHATACNHTAVHLVNAALRQVLGQGVRQAGSYVSPERFRFDYTIPTTPEKGQLAEVEKISNAAVRQDFAVCKAERPLKDAEALGAVTLLGEKYADPARFVLINAGGWDKAVERYSLELCGGTHVDRTGEIITVRIIRDSALSAGVRRVEGVAGPAAVEYFREHSALAERLAQKMATNIEESEARLDQILAREKALRQEINDLKQKLISGQAGAPAETIKLDGVTLVAARADGTDPGSLRAFCDKLRDQHPTAVILAAALDEAKMSFVVGLGAEAKGKFDASKIARALAQKAEGKAGGRADFAQGGGKPPSDWKAFAQAAAEAARGGN